MRLKLVVALSAIGALAAPGVASADVVTDWNRNMADALLVAHTAPQPATRVGAIVQTAVFDAVNGIAGRYEQFRPDLIGASAPHGASQGAAAAEAAYTALVALLPAQKATFDAELQATLASLSDDDEDEGLGQAVARGLAWGETVANAILAWRSTDGFTASLPPYVIGPLPSWQPTPPAFVQTPVFRQFATMTPWTMSSPDQFLPAPPPALTSARYTDDFNEVKTLGNAATTTQTLIETAKFWNGVFETAGPMWNRAAERLADTRDAKLVDNARLFALLNVSMADVVISVWNAKNTYNTWRPITAIRNADLDGNPATVQDAGWTPVLVTPPHQEYPSGHSGVSGAAAAVLAGFYGNDTTLTITSDGFPPTPFVARTYSSFSEAIAEVALARIAGGIHFRFACDAAAQMGSSVADQAMDTTMTPLHGSAR
jgi:PAP2 superfamily